jgi:hypothetical protein
MPENRSQQIATAASYLGVSGEVFIQRAINNFLRTVYGAMVIESEDSDK